MAEIAMYTTQSNLELMFGKTNIQAWADIDNTGDSSVIADRITWALQTADLRIDSKLRRSIYTLPFATTPALIEHMATLQAAILLYDGRGLVDAPGREDNMSGVRKDLSDLWAGLLSRRLRLEEDFDAATHIPKTEGINPDVPTLIDPFRPGNGGNGPAPSV